MTASKLAQRVADAFNHHGKFTARVTENNLAVEIRHADTGVVATVLYLPDDVADWMWFPVIGSAVAMHAREMRGSAGVDEVVRAVATSVLDEKRP